MTTTTAYNRSNITRTAWVLVKTQGLSFSQAMKQAWAEAKRPKVKFNTCDKTGLKFIGSKRQKNHPEVSKILQEASKLSSYFEVKKACEICKQKNMEIDEVLAFLNSIMLETSEQKRKESLEKTKSIKDFWKLRLKEKDFCRKSIMDEEDLDLYERSTHKSTFVEDIIER